MEAPSFNKLRNTKIKPKTGSTSSPEQEATNSDLLRGRAEAFGVPFSQELGPSSPSAKMQMTSDLDEDLSWPESRISLNTGLVTAFVEWNSSQASKPQRGWSSSNLSVIAANQKPGYCPKRDLTSEDRSRRLWM